MDLNTKTLVILFLILLWPKTNITNRLRQQYGQSTVQSLRQLEKIALRKKKINMDISFIKTCQRMNVIPNFCRLKPAINMDRKSLLTLQKSIMDIELHNKHRELKRMDRVYQDLYTKLSNKVSFFTLVSCMQIVHSSVKAERQKTVRRHQKKIENLRRKQLNIRHVSTLDNDKLVVNLSNEPLTDTETTLLGRGLAFCIPPRLNTITISRARSTSKRHSNHSTRSYLPWLTLTPTELNIG